MAKIAVIKTGGKQYLVKENDEILVNALSGKENDKIDLEVIAFVDGDTLELGTPALKKVIQGQVVSHLKGEKIRVAKFKSKVRYRKVRGFRQSMTRVKILSF